MNTVQYLDAVKRKIGVSSDYKLAQALGVMGSQIAQYRNKGVTLGDSVAIRVAELLELHPGAVVADMHAERSKVDQERAVWLDVADKLRGLAAAVLFFCFALAAWVSGDDSGGLALVALMAAPVDVTRYTLYAMAVLCITLIHCAKPLNPVDCPVKV